MRYMARAIRRTGWMLGCLTSLSCQIVTAHYDEVVASSRSQESPRSACAGVTSLIDPECFAASRGYWRLSGVFEQFVGVCPHHCRTGNPGPHTPEVQWGGRLTASASRCYPRRHELSSHPLGSFFSRTVHRRPPSADNVTTSARLDPAGQPRRSWRTVPLGALVVAAWRN